MPESVLEVVATFIGGVFLWTLELVLITKSAQILNLISAPSQNLEVIQKIEEVEATEEIVCSICLDNAEKGVFLPGCQHFFHKECISTWMLQASTCPYCRAII